VATKPLIAIVDDDDSVSLALQGLMKSAGLAAQGFNSAADFLAKANMVQVACLTLDVNMPARGDVALHCQLAESGPAIPTIFVTAIRAAALRHGALFVQAIHG
jgi:FixJ family two-component response regulator